jgi:hypothetical protein
VLHRNDGFGAPLPDGGVSVGDERRRRTDDQPGDDGGGVVPDDYRCSVTVVRGCRTAVALVTYRPVIALRCAVPEPPLRPTAWTTVVRGWRAAVEARTYRPLMALRACPERERLMTDLPSCCAEPCLTPLPSS